MAGRSESRECPPAVPQVSADSGSEMVVWAGAQGTGLGWVVAAADLRGLTSGLAVRESGIGADSQAGTAGFKPQLHHHLPSCVTWGRSLNLSGPHLVCDR